MDNPLTPNKIQRLIHLAEDTSFNMDRRVLLTEEDVKLINSRAASGRSVRCESSSGILDLEHVEGFGDSAMGNISLSKSTAFNPIEMSGRSTEADETDLQSSGLAPPRTDDYRRHSLALESFTNKLDKQTAEVNDIMRHSIASNYSFHSKRDLTADELSLIKREAPLPVQPSAITQFPESLSMNNSDLSVGAYFRTRCSEFGKILGNNDSPDKSMMPSLTEVSASTPYGQNPQLKTYTIDESLDCVPVRQPRADKICKKTLNLPPPTVAPEKQNQMSSKMDPKVQRVEPTVSKIPDKLGHKVTDNLIGKKAQIPGPSFHAHKSFMTSSKPTDVLLKNLHSSFKITTDDTEGSGENTFSISKIADYLGKQSNVSVSDMLKLQHKKPLTELHMNTQERQNPNVKVTYLKDAKNTETASSAGTVNTVISLEKMKINEAVIPEVVISGTTQSEIQYPESDVKSSRARSKSPSSKSQSTLSTVKENFNSFKSGDSPLHCSQGEARSKVPSPNVEYKELDKSVDWRDVLQQKHLRQKGLAKEKWAEIVASPVSGFVGVSCTVTIKVTTLTDSWLTAKLQFDDLPNDGKDLNIELPRLPLLLSPAKSEKFTFHMTSNVELNTKLQFTILLKDTSVDGDVPHKGTLEVNFKYPIVQAMSADGMNKVSYPMVQEKTCLTKSFVLISDCPVDLQLELSIAEGDSLFQIKNIQEIKKSEVNKVLLERQGNEDQPGKSKSKGINKQLCRLSNGNAIRVVIIFNAPKLSDLQLTEPKTTFNGVLNVNLIGLNTVLRKVDLVGVVGSASLQINVPGNKLHVSNVTPLSVSNTGTVTGAWRINYQSNESDANNEFPFKITSQKFEIQPGATKTLSLSYIGSEDNLYEATLIFEEIATGKQTTLEISGGTDKPKSFPIKTNYNTLSWVRAGRKELSLKNSTDSKILMRCQITGDGFAIDLPGYEARGIYCIQFNERECRPLPIIFMPTSCMPYHAAMYLSFDKNSSFRRRVKLFGCASTQSVRWSGLVTYSDTALVRAAGRAPVDLKLYNKSTMPAFIAARVHFNLQFMSVEPTARVTGARRIVAGRSVHAVSLRVDWARVERRAHDAPTTALATVTVLTGAELTRRRILKYVHIVAGRSVHAVSLRVDWARVERRAHDAPTTALATVTVLTGAELTRRRILKYVHIVAGRSVHAVSLRVDWARVERRAHDAPTTALATVTVLTGAELTRRRILKYVHIVAGRSVHAVSLRVDWARVERRAHDAPTTALATVTVLTGAELTRRRILKYVHIVAGRSVHAVSLRVDWARVERRAHDAPTTALATVTVLTGAELTRRRILKYVHIVAGRSVHAVSLRVDWARVERRAHDAPTTALATVTVLTGAELTRRRILKYVHIVAGRSVHAVSLRVDWARVERRAHDAPTTALATVTVLTGAELTRRRILKYVHIVAGRSVHAVSLRVDWARVERRAHDAPTTALATVTVLTGAELTRRRILKYVHIVAGRSVHAVSLRVDWARVERRAHDAPTTALATVTVLTGAELTRRRILKYVHIVAGRSVHAVSLRVDWARVERRAHDAPTTALATVTVLTGAELTRRRILKYVHIVAGRSVHAVSLRVDWARVERRAHDAPTTALATVTVLTGAELTRRRILKYVHIVAGRSVHAVSLRVDWARVERRAHDAPTTALATVTVLTGAELTRRRILKILKDESNEMDLSLLPDHLKILTGPFDGEDSSMDNFFSEFEENKASLNELISGLQELTAHIDLPQDFADENTIIISDDTVIDHHTICD